MTTGRRVQRLREMVSQIERLPASTDRDRLLSEVRSRAVDLETGEAPRAILPLREPVLLPEPPGVSERDTARVTRTAPQPPAPAVEFAPPAAPSHRPSGTEEPSPWASGRLSLEDPLQLTPLPLVRGRGGRAVPPWTLGLRG